MNYNYKEIDKLYTNIVTDYLNNGYTIYTPCMAGHQGEITKIVLTNSDNELTCVYMDKEYSWEEGDRINIVIGKYEHNNYKRIYHDDTLWLNELEEVKKYTFYEINDNNGYYTDDIDFLKECKKKRLNRFRLRYEMEDYSPVELKSRKAFLIAYRICKRTRGYKTVKPRDIISVIKSYNKRYVIKVNGKDDLIIDY